MHQFANMPMTTQSRMQQIDTLANYPMGTKPDSFRLIKKTFKSGEPMKTKIICFIAFVSYTFYLTAGDIYVSPYGNDTMLPVHANLPSRLWNKPSSKRANGEDCNHPKQPEA